MWELMTEQETHAAANPKLTVYFDGSCPLCRREIDFYRRRRGADRVAWTDVSTGASCDLASDLTCQQAMARFHVRLPDGTLRDGGAAFIALWRVLPSFRWLGLALSPSPLQWLANRAYDAFLRVRPSLQAAARR